MESESPKRKAGRPRKDIRNAMVRAEYKRTGSLRKTAGAFAMSHQRVSRIVRETTSSDTP